MGHTPCAEEENQLEVPLGRSVAVIHDQHPAAPTDGGARVAESCDEVIHETARGETDFLRHPQLIAHGARGGK
jgi:hypothetical protein